MMLNVLIFSVLGLLVILIAIRYGFLELMAIVLAVVALIPFGTSVYLYFASRPSLTYQFANKSKTTQGTKHVYEAWLGLQASRGRVLLDGVYLAMSEPGLTLTLYGGDLNDTRLTSFEETRHTGAIRLDSRAKPFFSKTSYVYRLRFESESAKASFSLDLFVDTKVDPAKLGFFSVFQPAHTYRFGTTLQADFTNLDRQEGELRPTY